MCRKGWATKAGKSRVESTQQSTYSDGVFTFLFSLFFSFFFLFFFFLGLGNKGAASGVEWPGGLRGRGHTTQSTVARGGKGKRKDPGGGGETNLRMQTKKERVCFTDRKQMNE